MKDNKPHIYAENINIDTIKGLPVKSKSGEIIGIITNAKKDDVGNIIAEIEYTNGLKTSSIIATPEKQKSETLE